MNSESQKSKNEKTLPDQEIVISVHVPAGVEWEIEEYDGLEHVAEKHRVWHGENES